MEEKQDTLMGALPLEAFAHQMPKVVEEPALSRRYALIVGQGSNQAIAGAKKIVDLLGHNPRGHNFTMTTLIESVDKDRTFSVHDIVVSLRLIADQLTKDDNMLVYICLRNVSDEIDYYSLTHITNAQGEHLKNLVLILDVNAKLNFSDAPFSGIPQGVSLFTLNVDPRRVCPQNKKYTYFSGLIVQALKGGAADMFGIITMANLFSYVEESVMFEPNIHAQIKTRVSESLFLRRVRGVLRRREMNIFCTAFHTEDDNYELVVSEEEVEKKPELKALIPRLLELHMIDCFQTDSTFLYFYKLVHRGYKLSAYGKHCQDMWRTEYFKFL